MLVKLTPEDGETTDAISQEFDKGEEYDDEIKDVPTILQKNICFTVCHRLRLSKQDEYF